MGQGEATPMALVQQLDPVYADFQQPVAEAQRLRAALAEGRLAQTAGKDGTPVSLKVDGTGLQRTGRLLFSDVTVDRGTGQMALRGRFDNRDGMLLPGMYVRVTVGQGVDPAAILVPQRAVQRSTDGQAHVLVVDGQDTLQMRPVQTAAMHGAQEGLAVDHALALERHGLGEDGGRIYRVGQINGAVNRALVAFHAHHLGHQLHQATLAPVGIAVQSPISSEEALSSDRVMGAADRVQRHAQFAQAGFADTQPAEQGGARVVVVETVGSQADAHRKLRRYG